MDGWPGRTSIGINDTYEWLVLRPVALYNDHRHSAIVRSLDDQSVVGGRILEPRSNLACDLELVPGAR